MLSLILKIMFLFLEQSNRGNICPWSHSFFNWQHKIKCDYITAEFQFIKVKMAWKGYVNKPNLLKIKQKHAYRIHARGGFGFNNNVLLTPLMMSYSILVTL